MAKTSGGVRGNRGSQLSQRAQSILDKMPKTQQTTTLNRSGNPNKLQPTPPPKGFNSWDSYYKKFPY